MIALIYFEMQFLDLIRISTVMFAAAFFWAKFSQIYMWRWLTTYPLEQRWKLGIILSQSYSFVEGWNCMDF
jgi:hypothetical protein